MAWATHVLQWLLIEGSEGAIRSKPQKQSPSSDCRLQPACMKQESLVIAGQHTAVNTFPGLVHTARHTTKVIHTRRTDSGEDVTKLQVGILEYVHIVQF